MKKSIFNALLAAMVVLVVDTSQAQDVTPTTDPGVKIGNVVWATRNVGEAGKFVDRPEDFGNHFTFEEAKTACPEGWRTPTWAELAPMIDIAGEWPMTNDVKGRRFGSGEASIFLPAAGGYNRGHFANQGAYWSSTPPEDEIYEKFKEKAGLLLVGTQLIFNATSIDKVFGDAGIKSSVRCVRK
jgi:uncharacterized protein (TIGR02145 family)